MLNLENIISLPELALKINASLKLLNNNLESNSLNQDIMAVEVIEKAKINQVTFLANPLYAKYLAETNASAVIISPKYLNSKYLNAELLNKNIVLLVTDNPRLALAKLLNLCAPAKKIPAVLGKNVIVETGAVIGDNCSIGDNTVIKANVVLYDNVKIGNNCLIHSNTVIGSDGFGFATDEAGNWVKMPHLGGVVIGDNVEIGSNTSIDRGCIGDTIIGTGVIIDNLVQIAHNVTIGEHTAIAGCTGIAGSTTIGKRCLIGGAVNIGGHLVIEQNVTITATSTVNKSLLIPGLYSSGLFIEDNKTWQKNTVLFNKLAESFKKLLIRIKKLEKTI